jgi:hypothetical protein
MIPPPLTEDSYAQHRILAVLESLQRLEFDPISPLPAMVLCDTLLGGNDPDPLDPLDHGGICRRDCLLAIKRYLWAKHLEKERLNAQSPPETPF